MDISYNYYKPFVASWNRMKDKYGEKFEIINGLSDYQLSNNEFIDNFMSDNNLAIDPSANRDAKNVRNLLSEMPKSQWKADCFNKIYLELAQKYGISIADAWLEGEWNGASYLHDASSSTFYPYCYAYDIEDMVNRGEYWNEGEDGHPAKHLDTFHDHLFDFVKFTSNLTAGACGLPAYFVYSYYFWKKDVEAGYYTVSPERYREQQFQSIIYKLNRPHIRIIESAFTNFSIMDREYLVELFGGRTYPDGSYVIDNIDGIIEHEKKFMEVLAEERKTRSFTFPVLTYSLLYQNGKFVDEEFAMWCCKHNMKWMDSNFYVGNDVTTLSNCCRLLSNTSKLDPFINSIGGTSLSVGSIKVNTINLHRIAIEAEGSQDKYLEILGKRIDICVKVLDVIRDIMKRNVDRGLLPIYTLGMMDMEKQYSTIGITAMYEAMDQFGYIDTDEFGNKSYSDKAIEFSCKIMNAINEKKDSYDLGCKFNVECIPAERANVVLCQKDNLLYPDQKHSYYIYSNQWIPLKEQCSLSEKVRLGSLLDKQCGGGQISHINVDGDFANFEQAWELLNKIAQSGLIYFAFNSRICECANHHMFRGSSCPTCGKIPEQYYTRVVGFITPVSRWSKERKREFNERQWWTIKEGML